MQDDRLRVALETLKQWDQSWDSFKKVTHEIRKNQINCRNQGILICERNPWKFIGAFFASIYETIPVFLGNPDWRESEWNQVFKQITPALILGDTPKIIIKKNLPRDLKLFSNCLMITTGGTSGKIRFAIHTWESLCNSALATAAFLDKKQLNCLCLLPLYHISGLIQVIRAAVTSGQILFDSLDTFDKNFNFNEFCLSLVPTQLERFIQDIHAIELLRTFNVIFLGGAPANSILLKKARNEKIRLALTYGMTETGSMVTALKPEDFLKDYSGVGQPLPHAEILIDNDKLITIRTTSLFSGYFPDNPIQKSIWKTNDEGIINDKGYLIIRGRADRIIISGGEKIDPKEVEEAILSTNLVSSVIVVGVNDSEWGQRVTAIYVPFLKEKDLLSQLKDKLKNLLVNYKIPKDWLAVDQLPYDAKGKITQISIHNCLNSNLTH